MMEKIKELFHQAVKFGLVGVINTLIDYAVTNLLVLLPFFEKYYIAANVIGFLCGMGNSLVMNKKWTFKQKEKMTAKQLFSFLVVNLIALGVSSLVLTFTQENMSLPFYIGKAVAAAASVGVNFIGNKILVFRDK